MGLRDFYSTVCNRNSPAHNQSKFIRAMLRAATSGLLIRDNYGRMLFSRVEPISEPRYNSFPKPINREGQLPCPRRHIASRYDSKHATLERRQNIAALAGLPRMTDTELDGFLLALSDWFEAFIHEPEHCDLLESTFRPRLNVDEPEAAQPQPAPLPPGERAEVMPQSSRQNNAPGFRKGFTHEWSIRNLGTIPWDGRKLVCVNSQELGNRPIDTTGVSVPDRAAPQPAPIKTSYMFSARSKKSTTIRLWLLQSTKGQEYSPGETTVLDAAIMYARQNSQPQSQAMSKSDFENWVTTNEVAARLDVCSDTTSKLISNRALPTLKWSKVWNLELSEIGIRLVGAANLKIHSTTQSTRFSQ